VKATRDYAVTFADISGSSRFHREYGDQAARDMIAAFCDAAAVVAPSFGGRLVKTMGDGVMCVFDEAEQSVLAMMELHARMTAMPTAQGIPIRLHTGINAGPVIMDGSDVYGTVVNVAAYLSATARADQILTTEAVRRHLSKPVAAFTRQLYTTKLKGDASESLIYEIIWEQDAAEITIINSGRPRVLPADEGALLLVTGESTVRVDGTTTRVTLGRNAENDLPVGDTMASREHATIELDDLRFRLIDHSANGTYVAFDGSPGEVLVLRGETLLHGTGRISLGRSLSDPQAQPIRFERDKRSLFRVG
jgi:class 3 adenylate cyclase